MPYLMSDPSTRFLCTPEAARYLSLSGRTLEKHRTYGTGPAYRKIGGRVIYALDDLRAWADLGTKTSTSDPGKGTVLPAKKPQSGVPSQARNLADSRGCDSAGTRCSGCARWRAWIHPLAVLVRRKKSSPKRSPTEPLGTITVYRNSIVSPHIRHFFGPFQIYVYSRCP